MTAANYPACFAHILTWEGGYVNHPNDPGGETNMGISKRAHPHEDIKNMTKARAGAIYRTHYWDRLRGDALPDGMDLVAFDAGVNSGVSRGAKWLQKALGVKADGKIGTETLAATITSRGVPIIQKACANRLGFLRGLGTWKHFGKGWGRRVAETEAMAVAMYTRSPAVVEGEARKAASTGRNQGNAAAASTAGGGAGLTLELPGHMDLVVLALTVCVVLVLVARIVHNRRRKAAYEVVAREMGDVT